jgi:plasmid segregation protein ParM
MKRFISVDSGKFATKGALRKVNVAEGESLVEKEVKFLTRIDNEDVDFGLLADENTHFVNFRGKKYRVGDNASDDSFSESKAEDIHKICTYTAIGMLVEDGDEVTLAVGCPLSVFLNKRARIDYQRFMLSNHEEIVITVDGRKHRFTINKVIVFPEGAGVVYLNFNRYKDKTVGVIDLGGLNTNCCVYKNIAPVAETIFTTRLGGKRMRKDLLDLLNSSLNASSPISDYQMDEIMERGYVYDRRDKNKETRSKQIIHDYRYKHVKKIYDSCIEHNWAVDNMDIVFVGGTSLFLKEEIKEVFGVDDSYFFENADMLNARGYLVALS